MCGCARHTYVPNFFLSQSVISFLGYLLLNYHFSMVTKGPKIGNDPVSVVDISLGIGSQDQVLGMFSHERDPWPSGCGKSTPSQLLLSLVYIIGEQDWTLQCKG